MVGAGLSAPTQSSAGIAANAAAPAASYVIGQEFKRRNAEGSLGHLLAHATLGGLTAAAGGNDPLAGALSSGGAEAAAGYISGLFGQTDGSRLSTEQKETVTAIAGLLGTAAGAALGSTPADAVQGSLNARNSVENNELAFSSDSQKNAVFHFNQKVRNELGGKFELQNTGRKNAQGYDIFELVALRDSNGKNNYMVSDLNPDELKFYNMLNAIIQDKSGSSNITLVSNDGTVMGGSWLTGRFDVGDMEKLDAASIVLSGNVLIAHEFNEQLDKNKLGLNAGERGNDSDFNQSHRSAILQHEPAMLPAHIQYVEDDSLVNGVQYDKLYYDNKSRQLIGILFGRFNDDGHGNEIHLFQPTQTNIKPNSRGQYTIVDPKNPQNFYTYPPQKRNVK